MTQFHNVSIFNNYRKALSVCTLSGGGVNHKLQQYKFFSLFANFFTKLSLKFVFIIFFVYLLTFAGNVWGQVAVLHSANFNSGADGYSASTYTSAKDWVRGATVTVDGMTISSGVTNFYYLVSDLGTSTAGNSYLTSSVFSTVGYSNINVIFRDFFYQASPSNNSTIYLEYSINGGSSYTSIDITKDNAGTRVDAAKGKLGANNDFRVSNISIPVDNQENVRIRFRYYHSNDWVWAIDDIKVTGVSTASWNAKPTYSCQPTFTREVESINRVQFADIDNISNWKGKRCETGSSAANTGAQYEDFTNASTNVVAGSSYNLTVYGHTNGNYTCYIRAYFDWNGDGDFDDTGESVDIGTFSNNNNGSVSKSITVPASAIGGVIRMRIMKRYYEYSAGACQTGDGYGQAEDYTLYLVKNYAAEITAIDYGSPDWCIGETRNVTFTLKNTGTRTWYKTGATDNTTCSTNPNRQVAIAIKWNGDPWFDSYGTQGLNRFPLPNDVASGASVNITLTNVPTPNGNPTGANNLSINLIAQECQWFVNPGSVYTSPAINIKPIPTSVSAGSDVSICSGSNVQLSGSATALNSDVVIGTPTADDLIYPFNTYYEDSRSQFLILGTELNDYGITQGYLNSISFFVNYASPDQMNNFNLRLKHTSNSSLTGWETGFTSVYSGSYTVGGIGWQTISFQTPFYYDGSSNLVFEICFDNNTWNEYSYIDFRETINNRMVYYAEDGAVGCNLTSFYLTNSVPIVQFGYLPTISYSWSPTTNLSNPNISNPIASPSSTTTYTMTASLNGCGVSDDVTVSMGAIPAVPVVSNSAPICNGQAVNLTSNGLAPGVTTAFFNASTNTNSVSYTGTTNNFTMEMWVKPTGTIVLTPETTSGISANLATPNQKFVVYPGHGGPSNGGIGISVGTNGVAVYEHGDGHFPSVLVYAGSLSNWTHIAVVYDNKTPNLYINGTHVRTGLTSLRTNVFPTAGVGTSYGNYIGYVDNFRIWNSVRTQTQISNNMYLEVPSPTTGMIAHYRFNSNTNASVGTSLTNNGGTFGAQDFYTYTWSGTSAPAASFNETQTTGSLTAGTHNYTVVASGGGCPGTTSAVTSVVVHPAFSAGAITGPASSTQCYNYNPTALTANPSGGAGTYSYQWQSSSDGSTWSNIGGATSATYDPPALTSTTHYRVLVDATGTPDCGGATASTNTLTYTIRPNFTAGAINTTGETICYNGNPGLIGSSTAASGGDGTITYEWRANGVAIASSNSATYDPPAGLTSTTTYTRWAKDGLCNTTFTQSTGSWKVTVTPTASAGTVTAGTTPQCIGGTTTYTVSGVVLGGGTGSWSSSSTAVATVNASTGEVTAVSAGTCNIVYTVNDGCGGTKSASASYTVNADHTLSSASSESVCINTAISNIQISFGGGATSASVSGLPNGVSASISGSTLTISGVPTQNGVYNYTVTTSGNACATASVNGTITVNPPSTTGLTLATNDYLWYGKSGTDWGTDANWLKYNGSNFETTSIPTSTSNVVISKISGDCNSANQPVVNSVNGVCNTLLVASGATILIDNNQKLTVNSNINNAGSFNMGSSSNLDIKGNWTNTGTFTAGDGTVTFSGSSLQNIESGGSAFNNVNFDNSAGFNVNEPMTIEGAATFNNGIVNFMTAGSLTFGNSATSNIGNANSYVNGIITKTGSSAFNFATGDGEYWGPCGIAAPSANSTIIAQYIHSAGPANYHPNFMCETSDLHHTSGVEHWLLTSTNKTPAVTLYWNELSGVVNSNELVVAHYDEANYCWNNKGGSVSGNSITSTIPFSSYSPISLGTSTDINPLPVELLSFTAECNNNSEVLLAWTTASEINNDYFEIQRSTQALSWEVIATVLGAGYSSSLLNYSYLDKDKPNTTIYYRLRQVDYDGTDKFSDIIQIRCENVMEKPVITVYPNPFNSNLNIEFENWDINYAEIELLDITSRIIKTWKLENAMTNFVYEVNLSNLNPAMYMLKIKTSSGVIMRKIEKQ